MKFMRKSFVFLILFFAVGCASPNTTYYWGEYQNLIYTQYNKPGKALPEYQIEKLEADIEKARSANKPLPPGFYAHLGYQYLLIGRGNDAKQCFLFEKSQFPESAVLMNRFLKKLK